MRAAIALAIATLALARDASSDPHGGTVTGQVLVFENGKPKPRDEVWVYLEAIKPRRARPDPTKLPAREIRQVKEEFVPHVVVVPVGTTVWFPNDDTQEHNVFSPTDQQDFDLERYNTDHKGRSRKFDRPGDVEIYCDIHKCMWARVKVVDADPAWIAKVGGGDGKFRIDGVPAGTYKLHAWSYDSNEVKQTIEVAEGKTIDVPVMHLQLGTMKPHKRKDGSDYPVGYHNNKTCDHP